MGKKIIIGLSLIALLLAVWPNASSLYDLTGEEEWDGQLVGLIHWLNTAVRPQPQLAPHITMQHADVSPFGMNTFLQLEAEIVKRDETLRLLNEAGFRSIRQGFPWEDIEIHGRGDFIDRRNDPNGVDAWAKYDNIVDLAETYDIAIIARLDNPPSWSRTLTDTIGTYAPPDDYNDFGNFVATVAERYQGRIRYYQIWNEPNGNLEWGDPALSPVNPEEYTELLCLAYGRIKAVDPDAVVLAGALTPTVEMSPANVNDLVFLQRMYNAGASDCFDIMSAQGYGLWSGPTDQRLRPNVINYPHHMFLRDMMVRNGDGAKPIWISEMGWNTVPEELPADYGRVNEQQQAAYGVEAYERAQTDWPWLGVVNYWFFKRPADFEKNQSWYYFRLMEPDFTPLPAWEQLAEYARDPGMATPMPGWQMTWLRLRPFLFLGSSAILFFMLLQFLQLKANTEHAESTEQEEN